MEYIRAFLIFQIVALAGGTAFAAKHCSPYEESGPIIVQDDNQIIRNLTITSTGGPGIDTNGHSGVQIQNVIIHHNGGPGIFVNNSNEVSVSGADIIFDGAPPAGANELTGMNNIECSQSANLTVANARLTRGSSGIYLLGCPGSKLSFIEGHDQRGPFPRGQLVQWNASDNGLLTDFSNVASLSTSWTEDNVNVYHSNGITIARGLLDTNTSPHGDGVIVDELSGNVTVTDVDAIHQGNGCFGVWGGGGHDVTFTRTRCRDNYCSLPRGAPSSNSIAWAVDPTSIRGNLKIEQSSYANLCNPKNIVYDARMLSVKQIVYSNFTPRKPIVADLCPMRAASAHD